MSQHAMPLEMSISSLDAGHSLPAVFTPVTEGGSARDLIGWLGDHGAELEGALDTVGGALIRGVSLPDTDAFQTVAQAYLEELLPYMEGQSPRTKVRAAGVYTSTEYPKNQSITLHQELSYVATPPARILFFCETEASTGGETPIVDGRRVSEALDPEVRARFDAHGILYVKHMHGDKVAGIGRGKSWQDHFETEDRDAVETYLTEGEVAFEWHDDNSLTTRQRRPAFVPHRKDGRPVWFNQSNLWHLSNFPKRVQTNLLRLLGEARLPTHAYFGNGEAISNEDMDHVRSVCLDESSRFLWQQGDLLILDNLTVAHGRMPFDGPRRVLVAMG